MVCDFNKAAQGDPFVKAIFNHRGVGIYGPKEGVSWKKSKFNSWGGWGGVSKGKSRRGDI